MGGTDGTIYEGHSRFLREVSLRGRAAQPEILLENAVQDELENLKKLQVAAARTMAYEKMLSNDAVTKQKTLAVKERQAREFASRGQRGAAIEVVQQKQEAEASLADIEARLEEARKNSQELEQAFRDQERRYNDVVRERAALMEEHQRSRALRTANEARANISLSDSTRDLDKARQSIRQSSYEAQAIGVLEYSRVKVSRSDDTLPGRGGDTIDARRTACDPDDQTGAPPTARERWAPSGRRSTSR